VKNPAARTPRAAPARCPFDGGQCVTNLGLMNEYIRYRGYAGATGGFAGAAEEKLAFLRRVYGYFTGSVLAAAAGAMVALHAGADLSQLAVRIGHRQVIIPPLVAFFANHWLMGMALMIGSFMLASYVRERPGVNVAALLGAGFVSGIYVAPMIWVVSMMATQGLTLSASPVRDAFLLAAVGFSGLSAYALLSHKDFSSLRGFVSMGFWVLVGAIVLNFFFHSSAFSLAIASVGVLLFGAYILYNTSQLRRDQANRDPVGAAIGLYLNFLNLFLFLLQILGAGRRDS
jgi:modulator of FtsH protease